MRVDGWTGGRVDGWTRSLTSEIRYLTSDFSVFPGPPVHRSTGPPYLTDSLNPVSARMTVAVADL